VEQGGVVPDEEPLRRGRDEVVGVDAAQEAGHFLQPALVDRLLAGFVAAWVQLGVRFLGFQFQLVGLAVLIVIGWLYSFGRRVVWSDRQGCCRDGGEEHSQAKACRAAR
jgi:hypothetical protein